MQDNEAVVALDQSVDPAVSNRSNQTNDEHRTEPSESVPGLDDAIKLADTADTSSWANAAHPWLVALWTFRKLSTKIMHHISLVTDHPTYIAWFKKHLKPSSVDRGPHLAWPPRDNLKQLHSDARPPVKLSTSKKIGRPPNLLKGKM
uniref:(northern house mosquito) hypothetical protein n=1 Tax=Culex pipiens TaxID=7175 RepID=A0A8D8EZQ0_CULPI